ncbi:hypothetical protein BGW36DRAFT_380622 [Talaromyces proteolyticus]|uniref:Uncharacterized protein n=1 Tax=Talaromyces proteolyticus TaxID=1131652 RepID=A0AAD4PXD7_9EURO|nr:uncharacterized protein BGW36DRAFT_380622 [Talaromyces proteolyticus]KAH8696289.1 hypothetical protein BGW36DRAFT_380622 [Talaromyces proteolyticus]
MPESLIRQHSENEIKLNSYTSEVHAWKKDGCLQAPPDAVAGTWEGRQAFIQVPWQTPLKVAIEKQEKGISAHNSMQYTQPPTNDLLRRQRL